MSLDMDANKSWFPRWVAVLALGIVIGAVLTLALAGRRMRGPELMQAGTSLEDGRIRICERKQVELPASSEVSQTFVLKEPGIVHVKVEEMFGKNISYRVLRNGKRKARLRPERGQVEGEHLVEPGTIAVVVENGNMFDAKNVFLTVWVETR